MHLPHFVATPTWSEVYPKPKQPESAWLQNFSIQGRGDNNVFGAQVCLLVCVQEEAVL